MAIKSNNIANQLNFQTPYNFCTQIFAFGIGNPLGYGIKSLTKSLSNCFLVPY